MNYRVKTFHLPHPLIPLIQLVMKFFNRHPLEEQVKSLAERDQFLDLLDWVAAGRETCINQLARAPEGRLREISGKIQVYDEILNLCSYDQLLLKRAMRKAQGMPQ